MSCVTNTNVFPAARLASNTSMHLRANAASPTANTSSINITSASASAITANANRTNIPDE